MTSPRRRIVDDYLEEARASMDIYYEFQQPGLADRATDTRLLEVIAESLVSIADSLARITQRWGVN